MNSWVHGVHFDNETAQPAQGVVVVEIQSPNRAGEDYVPEIPELDLAFLPFESNVPTCYTFWRVYLPGALAREVFRYLDTPPQKKFGPYNVFRVRRCFYALIKIVFL